MSLGQLLAKIEGYNPRADLEIVQTAYKYSALVHKGQTRSSGEPYVTHPLAVAELIADMRLDVPTVVTGLLHDTVEDTLATVDDIQEKFGTEVAALVDGVTKISQLEGTSQEAARADTLRKMFLASAQDIRVLLVKLADRAHNMRTLGHLKPEKQERIAKETLDLYAPLAHRMGVHWLKAEFEETGFRTLFPEQHDEVCEKLSLHRLQREGYIGEITSLLGKRLRERGVETEVSGRTKGVYSIYKKMNEQSLKYDDIYDVVAFRLLVDSELECYDGLGIVHTSFPPVPGRFRDYVALPKANRYQSLHTTVIGPYGERMEVQIRTHEMHRVAQYGIAAHWKYKSPDGEEQSEQERYLWLSQILEWQQHLDDPHEYLSSVKEDLFAEEVYVFTPKGETRTFRKGDTVLDFAYRIHSEVGDHSAGARVNGKLVPLRYALQQGDTVEIVTTADAVPTREWLKYVRSPRARERILAWIRHDERTKAIALGQELLDRDLKRRQLDLARLRREGRMPELLREFQRDDEDKLFEAVGYGRVTTRQVLEFLLPGEPETSSRARRGLNRLLGMLDRQPKPLVVGDDIDESMVRYGKCCEPLAGEPVVGFVTRGRGVTVHSKDCPRLEHTDPERFVEVNWRKGARALGRVKIEVVSRDRPALLANLSQAIASSGANIDKAQVRTLGADATSTFEVILASADELARMDRNLRRVPGVRGVRRMFG